MEIPNRDSALPPFVIYWCTNARPLLYDMTNDVLAARKRAKAAMKENVDNPFLYNLNDARQLTLKLFANSIYGYTGASPTMNDLSNLAISSSITWYVGCAIKTNE